MDRRTPSTNSIFTRSKIRACRSRCPLATAWPSAPCSTLMASAATWSSACVDTIYSRKRSWHIQVQGRHPQLLPFYFRRRRHQHSQTVVPRRLWDFVGGQEAHPPVVLHHGQRQQPRCPHADLHQVLGKSLTRVRRKRKRFLPSIPSATSGTIRSSSSKKLSASYRAITTTYLPKCCSITSTSTFALPKFPCLWNA